MTYQQVVMSSPGKRPHEQVEARFPSGHTIGSFYRSTCEVLGVESRTKNNHVPIFYCPHRFNVDYVDVEDSTPPKVGRALIGVKVGSYTMLPNPENNTYKHDIPLAIRIYPATAKTAMLTIKIGVVVALDERKDVTIEVPDPETPAQEEYAGFIKCTETLALMNMDFRCDLADCVKIDNGRSLDYTVDMSHVAWNMDGDLSGHIIIHSNLDRENAMYWRANIEASMLKKYIEESKRTFFPKNTVASVGSTAGGAVAVAKADQQARGLHELMEDADKQVEDAKAAIQSAQDGEDEPDQTSFFLTPGEAYWKEMHRIEKNKGKLQAKLAKEELLLAKQQQQELLAKQGVMLTDAHHKADHFEESWGSEKLISDYRDKSAKEHEMKALKLEEELTVKNKELTDASHKAQELTQLIRRLPTPLWSTALDINGAKKEFARFYNITVDVNESDVVTGHNFNIYSIRQETSNIFCLLMSDVQRKEVIDVMVHAFENGEGTMRDSYKTLFQRYSRSVEYAHNRQRQDHQAKKVEKNRETWVNRLTTYFNKVVKERFDKIEVLPVGGAGGAAGGAADGAGGAADGAADGAAGGDDGEKCTCCGRVPPENCTLYD